MKPAWIPLDPWMDTWIPLDTSGTQLVKNTLDRYFCLADPRVTGLDHQWSVVYVDSKPGWIPRRISLDTPWIPG